MFPYLIFRDWKDKRDNNSILFYCNVGKGCKACTYLHKYKNKLLSKFLNENDKLVAYALHLSKLYTEEYLISIIPNRNTKNIEEEVMEEHTECYEEFLSAIEIFWFVQYKENNKINDNNSNNNSNEDTMLSVEAWKKLCIFLRKFASKFIIDAPLVDRAAQLVNYSNDMDILSHLMKEKFFQYVHPCSRSLTGHSHNICNSNSNSNRNGNRSGNGNGNIDQVDLISAAARISQVARSGDVYDNARIFGTCIITVMMLDLNLVNVPHSCVPSHSFKVARLRKLSMLNKNISNSNNADVSNRQEESDRNRDRWEREFDNDIAYEVEMQVVPLFEGKTKTSSSSTDSNSSSYSNRNNNSSSMTISRLGLTDVNDVQSRRKQLNNLGFVGDCHCVRCSYERADWDYFTNRMWHGRDLLLLGYHYMREKNLIAANELFSWIFSTTIDSSDNSNSNSNINSNSKPQSSLLFSSSERAEAGHALGALLLSENKWTEALEIWTEAHAIDPKHHQLNEIISKYSAYDYLKDTTTASEDLSINTNIKFESVLNDDNNKNKRRRITIIPRTNTKTNEYAIFKTTDAVQSKEICESVIQLVEECANVHGWSQTRHYAVPTTDIAVHTHPKLLNWFKNLCLQSLYPLLAAQFPRDFDGNPANVYINDCFVVKYEARKDTTSTDTTDTTDTTDGTSSKEEEAPKSYLPLHVDEASHSVIIALNDPTDYAGGGTYFAASDSVVRLPQGQMLSFSGDVLHGGEPLLRGKRYIVAVFLYLRKTEKDSDNQGNIKKKNIQDEAEDTDTDDKKEKGFSFGFNF